MVAKRRHAGLESLEGLSPSEVTPIWLELSRRQAGRRRPVDLLTQLASDDFVAPSRLDQRTLHQLDGIALAAAEGFEALQLSPVAPLGVCSALAPTSQDRTLSAARGTEVVSDPTNVLALECARRLKRGDDAVRLCSAHQVLRAQALPPEPGFSRHFRLFVLADAGRALAEHRFEVEAVARHAAIFDRVFDELSILGCTFPHRQARVSCNEQALALRTMRALEATLPHLDVTVEPLRGGYYHGLRVVFGAETPAGEFKPIGDIGRFDWVAKLTSNRRLRFVASGLGIQLAPALFRADRDGARG